MKNSEKWIPDYEGYYKASPQGQIISESRLIPFTNRWGQNISRLLDTKHIFGIVSKKGYRRVILLKDGNRKTFPVHRLIALTFIPNPENKPQVNHKNGIKTDNRVENLEWCTQSENIQHSYDNGLHKADSGIEDSQSKPIIATDLIGLHITKFGSLCDASRSGFPRTCVSRVINGERESYKGFKFKYA